MMIRSLLTLFQTSMSGGLKANTGFKSSQKGFSFNSFPLHSTESLLFRHFQLQSPEILSSI